MPALLVALFSASTANAQQPNIAELLPGDCLTLKVEEGNYLGLVILEKSYPAEDTLFECVLIANPFSFGPPTALFAIDSLWGQRKPVLNNASKKDKLDLLLGGGAGKDFEETGEYRDELETVKLSATTLNSFLADLQFHGHISIKYNLPIRVAHTDQLMTRTTLLEHVRQIREGAPWVSKLARIRTVKIPLNNLLAAEGEPVRGEPPMDFEKFLTEAHADFAPLMPTADFTLDEPYAAFGTAYKRDMAQQFLESRAAQPDVSVLTYIAELGVKRQIGLAYLINAPEEFIRERNTDFLNLDQEVLTLIFAELVSNGSLEPILVNVGIASAERLIVFEKFYTDKDIYPGFFKPEEMAAIAAQYRDLLKQLQ